MFKIDYQSNYSCSKKKFELKNVLNENIKMCLTYPIIFRPSS